MKTWVRKTLSVGVLAAGALLFGSGAAYAGGGHHAGTSQHSWDNNGILNGTQVIAPIDIPVNVAGIGLGILGEGTGAGAASSGGWTEHGKVKQHSSDNNGILNGTQLYAPIDIPVNVAGIGIGVLGEGTGAGVASSGGGHSTEGGKVKQNSSDNNGVLNGTQAYLPINVPINIAGVGVGVLGEGTGAGAASSGRSTEHGKVKQHSSDNNGILNGTQLYAPIDIPVNVAGIGLGILGEGTGSGIATSGGHSTEGAGQDSSDNNGILNGTQILAPVNAPVNVCGIGIGVLGEGTGAAVCSSGNQGGDHGDDGGDDGDDDDVDGDHGDDGDYGDAPRGARGAATEASPVDGLTKGVTGGGLTQGVTGGGLTDTLNGGGLNLGGVPLLNTLR
jgi:hypothetical protein